MGGVEPVENSALPLAIGLALQAEIQRGQLQVRLRPVRIGAYHFLKIPHGLFDLPFGALQPRPFVERQVGVGLKLASAQEMLIERLYVDLEAPLFGELVEARNGMMRVPEGPGLGADPDPAVIARCR